jgi:pyruvate formate lyase activating enzyme
VTPPLIADIRRNALDDGPGIRSTVFFKGCPLACVWCQNPETLSAKAEIQRRTGACIGCQTCAAACPAGAVTFVGAERGHDRGLCRVCGTCVESCPPGALRVVGTAYAVDALVALLLQDEPFYRNSGGGVTFSGGEPTLHLAYLVEVAAALKAHNVHLLLETCGLYRAEPFETNLLPRLDMIYFDLKLADPAIHRRFTGQDNSVILGNLGRLVERVPDRLLVRLPLVPGITDTEANLKGVATVLKELGVNRLALLPYNPLWLDKRKELGLSADYTHDRFMGPEELQRCRTAMSLEGIEEILV